MTDEPQNTSRRDLLKSAALAGAGLAIGLPASAHGQPRPAAAITLPEPASAAPTMMGVPFERHAVVRVAIVGTGLRGRSVLHELLGVDNVRITALCDTVARQGGDGGAADAKGGARPTSRRASPAATDAYEQLVKRDDIDIVYTATPWEWHVPVCLAAMNAGKHAATEVPAAYTLDDCWKLVDASERTRRHCLMMENCNYGYNELLVLQMVKAGVFGELKHAGAAYNHDLREILFEKPGRGALAPRAPHAAQRQSLHHARTRPVAFMLGHQPRRPVRLHGVDEHAGDGAHEVARGPRTEGLAEVAERYVTGDLNISLIKTAKGRTIRLEHDVSSPRPYSRINSIQGTKGIFEDYPARIYVEGDGARAPLGVDRRLQGASTSTRSGASWAKRRAAADTAAWTT